MKMSNIKMLEGNLDSLIKTYGIYIENHNFKEAFNVMKNINSVMLILRDLEYINAEDNATAENNGIIDWYSILEFFVKNEIPKMIKLEYEVEDKKSNTDADETSTSIVLRSDGYITFGRRTGKTTALAKLSDKYNIPIYTDNQHSGREIEKKAIDLGLKNVEIIYIPTGSCLPQGLSHKLALVDDSTDIDALKEHNDKYNNKCKYIGFYI